jgi:hypothetical protein
MNQIKQMFELQQKLNDATNGLIWTEGATKEGRQIMLILFHSAIWLISPVESDNSINKTIKLDKLQSKIFR